MKKEKILLGCANGVSDGYKIVLVLIALVFKVYIEIDGIL